MKILIAMGIMMVVALGFGAAIEALDGQRVRVPAGEPAKLEISLGGLDSKDKCWIWTDIVEDGLHLWYWESFDSCWSWGKYVDPAWAFTDCSPPYFPFLVESVKIGMHTYMWPGPEDLDVIFQVEVREVEEWNPNSMCPAYSPGSPIWVSPPLSIPLPPGWYGFVEVNFPGVWVYEPFSICWHLLFHPPYHVGEFIFGWMTDADGVYPCLNWMHAAGYGWYEFFYDLGYDNDLVIRVGGRPQLNAAVVMGSFEAVPGDGIVTLGWQTLSEMNNAYWIIKRDGQKIARLEGQGSKETPTDYIYEDRGLANGMMYSYILEAWNYAGAVEVYGPVTAIPVAVGGVPGEFALSQNYPNPFNFNTDIRYQIPKDGHVVLKIFNTLGQEVRKLVDAEQKAGEYGVFWDGRDARGQEVASGLYFCRLRVGDFGRTIKMVLLR